MREELDDLNVDKRTLKVKDLNERQKTVRGEEYRGWRRKKEKTEKKERKKYLTPSC